MGARPYRYLSLYQPEPGCLIEIGSERGEGSTRFLDAYACRHKLRFYTADIDPDTHEAAKRITRGARQSTGVALLRRVRTPVSVAYLDGFDWTPAGAENEAWLIDQRARYAELGYEMTNENCQREHLAEAQLIADRAADSCVVICDDTWHDRRWTGKGGLAVPYLISQGFTVVDHAGRENDSSLGYAVLRR